jgi:sugar phosphate isomerase/epimerase
MNGSLHSYMKVGVVSFMAYPAPIPPLASLTALAQDPYFTAMEITHIANPEERAQVAAVLAASGLTLGFGAQPVLLGGKLDVNSLDEGARRAAVDRLRACIDEAQSLGCTRLGLLSGPYPGPERAEAAMAALVESLGELCAYAGPKGLDVALEVFDRTIDKKALIGATSDGVAVAKQMRQRYANFGLMMDLSHLPLQFESSEQALRLAGEYLIHAHIGNCILQQGHPAYGDSHPRFGHPAGLNDVAEVREYLRVLLDIGYIGPGSENIVAFEVKPLPGETPEIVLANAKRTLQRAWAGL